MGASEPAALGVWTNGDEWVVAADARDALHVWADAMGERPDDYADSFEWKRLPDEKLLMIDYDDEDEEQRTCAEWMAKGRGLLASTSV